MVSTRNAKIFNTVGRKIPPKEGVEYSCRHYLRANINKKVAKYNNQLDLKGLIILMFEQSDSQKMEIKFIKSNALPSAVYQLKSSIPNCEIFKTVNEIIEKHHLKVTVTSIKLSVSEGKIVGFGNETDFDVLANNFYIRNKNNLHNLAVSRYQS